MNSLPDDPFPVPNRIRGLKKRESASAVCALVTEREVRSRFPEEVAMFAAFAPLLLAAVTLGTPGDDEKGYLGVQIKNADSGVEIQAIVPDSPADKAGLRKDDIIVKINGEDAGNVQGFVQAVGA